MDRKVTIMVSCVLNFPLPETQEEIDLVAAEIRRAVQAAQAENTELLKPGVFFVTISRGSIGVTVEEDAD
jgi:hypothetical protein